MDNALAQRIIKIRSSLGWTQNELAQASGVAAAQISRYEQGRSQPRPEVLAKIAKALAVDFEWLLNGNPQQETSPEKADDLPTPKRPDKITIKFSASEYAWISELARENNLSVQEMAQRLLDEALAQLVSSDGQAQEKATQEPEPHPEGSILGDVVKRLAALEEQTKELASRVRSPSDSEPLKKN